MEASATTVLMAWLLACCRDYILFYIPVKALCTESQFPEDRFVDTYVAKARGEALDTPTDGDIFFYNNADYIFLPCCQLLTCKNYIKGDISPYTLDTLYRKY
jgi:hypothetical protein